MARFPPAGTVVTEDEGPRAPGAVLTGDEILELSADPVPRWHRLIQGIEEDNLKGAAYDLRMADDGMVLPNGEVIPPGPKKYRASILLDPGQTIFVSTREHVNVPHGLTGNMAINGELAGEGVLSLTGLIVDPGYQKGASGDGRLHFRLANLGSRPVILQPGTTKIASIQFVRLGRNTTRPAGTSFRYIWERTADLRDGLGFIEDLRKLERRTTNLETQLAQQGRAVNTVVVAVLFVVVSTLLGTAGAAFLSLGSNSDIVKTARTILPHRTGLKVLFVVGVFAFATVAYAIASVIRVGRAKPTLDPSSVEHMRFEAAQLLRAKRFRAMSLCGFGLALLIVVLVALTVNSSWSWYITSGIGLLVVIAALLIRRPRVWWPITRWDVDAQISTWETAAKKKTDSTAQHGGW